MRSSPLLSCVFAVAAAATAQVQAVVTPVTVVFQNDLDGYTGTFDRRIYYTGGIDGSLVTGQTGFAVDGGSSTLDDSAASSVLIRFSDLTPKVPVGAKILSAKLTFVQKTAADAQSGDAFSVYRLTRGFDSSSAMGAGTDFGPDGLIGDVDWIVGSFHGPNVASTASVVSADVTRAVQSWVDGSPNYGFGIRSDRGTNAWSFHSTGATQNLRPKLEVTYLEGDGVETTDLQQGLNGYAGTTDILLRENGATTLGSVAPAFFLDGRNPPTTEPDISAMIRFDGPEMENILRDGRRIESAMLRFVTGFDSSDATSPGPFTVHRLLVPFDETKTWADFAGDAGAMVTAGQVGPPIATFTGMANCEVVDVDISDALKAWAAGEPNYGLYIGSGSPNGWQIFTSNAHTVIKTAGQPDTQLLRPHMRPLIRVVSSPALPVEVVFPVANSRHVLNTPISFQVDTSLEAPATVTNVEFFVDGVSVGNDSSAPFTFSYPASSLGNFTLVARMTDNSSNVVDSEPVAFSVVPAAGSGGLYFDGLADHVALGDPAELKLSTFTLETWFRRETAGIATTTGTGGVVAIPLVAKGRNQADNSTLDMNWFLGIRESDGVLCADFEGANGTNVPIAGVTQIPYGEWNHVAATFDGVNFKIYLNGNLEKSVNSNGITPRADSIQHASIATAMNSNGLGEGAFGGFMDEVRIWNVARTDEEIRSKINSEVVSATGLVARWGMTEGTGTSITSSAAAGLTGNFGGLPVWTSGMVFSNNSHPFIRFTSPASGGSYLSGEPLTITVDASDADGSVAKVEYYDNGVLAFTSTTPPFSFSYAGLPTGIRRVIAVATDNLGAVSTTSEMFIATVNAQAPTIPGYSAGIIDGQDFDLVTGTPAASPAPWTVVSSTNPPRALTNPGTVSGDIAVNINGSDVPYDSGVVIASNIALDGNLAAIDNLVATYASGGNYRLINRDNNGPGEIDPIASPESSSFSLGFFPYAEGWIGANIAADGTVLGNSSSLPPHVTITKSAVGTYRINGLPLTGNMVTMAAGSDTDNYASITKSGDDWIVNVRDNSQNAEDGAFAILYIPDNAQRVFSGQIGNLGEFVALNEDAAIAGVSTRLSPQGYELTFGDGTVVNPSNTALLICADGDVGNGVDNAYSYSALGNSFVVFSHDLPGLNGVLQNGGFRFLAVPLNPVAPVADEVALSVTDAVASEDGSDLSLTFTVTRRGSTASSLNVLYDVSGTATSGDDFTALPGTVTIPAGESSAVITVNVLTDSVLEQDETVTLTVAPGSGYTPGLFITGTGIIRDSVSSVATTTVSFQEGLNGYTGQFQRRISRAIANPLDTATNGNTVQTYAVDGGDPDVNDIIRFDNILGPEIGRIPVGATILKAELVLTTGTGSNDQSNGPFITGRLIQPFTSTTTYSDVHGGTGFDGVRGISTDFAAGFPPAAAGQVVAADVTNTVRSWQNGQPNYGLCVVAAGTTDGWVYGTVGNSNVAMRPKLVVTYTMANTEEYTLDVEKSARINSAPGSSTTDGSTIDYDFLGNAINNSQEALIKFPVVFDDAIVGAIPLDRQIVKAELLVHTAAGYDNPSSHTTNAVNVHRMLQDWTTSSTFGVGGPRVGINVAESSAAMVGLGQDSTTWVDVTSIIRNWRAGAPNHGFNLKLASTDAWAFYWPGTALVDNVPKLRIITTAAGGGGTTDPFELWADAGGASGIALGSDDDKDGITALVEYALGFNPRGHDVLPGVIRNGNDVSISFPKGTQAAGDSKVSYHIMSSTNLVDWDEETTATQDAAAISLNQTMIPGGKKFYRLKVIYTP